VFGCALALSAWLGAGNIALAQFPSTNVGTQSAPAPITVTVSASAVTSEATAQVLTMGSSGLDFQTLDTSPCNGKAAGQSCTLSVTFTPTAPGLRVGGVQLLDNTGTVVGYKLISGTGTGGLGVLLSGDLQIVAGDGIFNQALGDGLLATKAELYLPSAVVVDGNGNLYISDTDHHRIRKVTAGTISVVAGIITVSAGTITTLAGDGTPGFLGDNGLASGSELNLPGGLALDGAGNLYIADTGNNRIRMIYAATSATPGDIVTVAGGGIQAPTVNGISATLASLNNPQGIALDSAGNLWISDTGDNLIREVTGGIINTTAGGGPNGPPTDGDNGQATSAQLNGPYAVAFDSVGNWYIADTGNNRVRKVDLTGTITKFAGNGTAGLPANGGTATNQPLYSPSGLAFDPADNLYLTAPSSDSISEICKVSQAGILTVVAKNLAAPVASAIPTSYAPFNLYAPIGITLDANGNIYVADTFDMEVKEIPSNLVLMDFTVQGPVRQEQVSPGALSQTLENDGNAPLTLAAYTLPTSTMVPNPTTYDIPATNIQVNTAKSVCPLTGGSLVTGGNLAKLADCTVVSNFAPTDTDASSAFVQLPKDTVLVSDISFADDASGSTVGGNSPLIIATYGDASPINSTTTTLPASQMSAAFGTTSPLNATVTTGYTDQPLTAGVTFYDSFNNGPYTVISPLPNGQPTGFTFDYPATNTETATASLDISTLPVGVHTIYACYNVAGKDILHTSSCSSPDAFGNPTLLTLTIYETTQTKVTAVPASPSTLGTPVTFTATVTIPTGTGTIPPDSTVNFTTSVTVAGVTTTTPLCSNVTVNPTTTATAYTAVCAPLASALVQGANLITANYLVDASQLVNPSSGSITQNVQAPTNYTFVSSANPSTSGSPVTFTFTIVGSPVATGTVTFLNGTTKLGTATPTNGKWTFTTPAATPLPTGSLTIYASYPGDANYAAVDPSITQVVSTATTTTVLNAPAAGVAGLPTAVSATVAAPTGSGTPTGTVTFLDGTTTLGTATLAGGTATLSPSPILPVGVNSLTAVYSGDTNDAGSTSAPVPVTISLGSTALAFVNPPATAVVELPVNFTVQVTSNGVTPTGSVVFVDGATPIGTVALAGGAATLTYTFTTTSATAPHAISATYAGDVNNAPPTAALPADVINVTAIPTQTSLATATTSGPDSSLILIATVVGVDLPTQFPPTGTVVFTNGSATLGSAQLANGVATFQPAATGQLNVIATYTPTLSPTDPLHLGSASAALAVTNNGNGFTLAATPTTLTISPSQNASVTLTITPVNGVKDTVGLGCGSLPPGMTCTFSPLTVVMDGVHAQSATLVIDTNNPLLGGATAMNTPPAAARTGGRLTLASIFAPLGLLCGLLLWRVRRRSALIRNASLLLLFAASAILMNGCGGIGKSAAVPGTYTIQVVGVGINSNITQYVSLTVTVTK
jgi:sugar lactone lactonase YvrE